MADPDASRAGYAPDQNPMHEWFRDRLHDTLTYGVGAFVVLGGWMISNDSAIFIHHESDRDKREAAVLLLIAVPILWVIWYRLVLHSHGRCPARLAFMRPRTLHLCDWGLAAALGTILYLVVND